MGFNEMSPFIRLYKPFRQNLDFRMNRLRGIWQPPVQISNPVWCAHIDVYSYPEPLFD